MINTNELRVGNWIYDLRLVSENPARNELQVKNIYGENNMRFYEGIPLSGNMERLGFKKSRHSNEYWIHWLLPDGWHISEWIQDKQMAGFEEKGTCYYGDNYLPVKFVHDLQNLYYAFTKKELTLSK